MTVSGRYPFSDLTPQQIRAIVRAAQAERRRVLRNGVAALVRALWKPFARRTSKARGGVEAAHHA